MRYYAKVISAIATAIAAIDAILAISFATHIMKQLDPSLYVYTVALAGGSYTGLRAGDYANKGRKRRAVAMIIASIAPVVAALI